MPKKGRSGPRKPQWKSPDEFVEFLRDVLIPDLEETGYDMMAEDFGRCVTLLEDDDYDGDFVRFLEETLIPDLEESGYVATVADFRDCVYYIKQNRRRTRRQLGGLPRSVVDRANAFVAEIQRNVDDYYANRIDYETFHVRQGQVWNEIVAAGRQVHDQVLVVLRRTSSPTLTAEEV